MYKIAQYYFLLSAFPPVVLGVTPELSFEEVKDLLVLNLVPDDMRDVERLLRPIDLYNMRAFWLNEPLDERGNYSALEIEEKLLTQESFPPYIIDFLEQYESNLDRLHYFSSLFASLYREEAPRLKGFLFNYYKFERELRLVLTALRAKSSSRDIVRELQFEDPTDPLVAEILAQKESAEYTPPIEFEDLKTIFMNNRSEPQKLNHAILEYRFKKIEEMEEPQDFTIDRVLAYLAKLMIAESTGRK